MSEEERAARQRRIPLVRGQIIALREAALHASRQGAVGEPALQAGNVLTSNMLAAFALELGLKVFHLAYAPESAHGHDLYRLFTTLPQQMQDDIRATYTRNLNDLPNVPVYAFRTAPEMPPAPAQALDAVAYGNADGLLQQCSKLFIDARYFPEQVGGEWVMIHHPIEYMRHMIDVLITVFDAYLERAAWQ